jgi:small-conductance mechanosensitive channel
MLMADLAIPLAADRPAIINAAIAMAIAFGVVALLRRAFARRGRKLAEAVLRGELTPEVDTRLRLVQRLIYAVVLLIGVATALAQFPDADKAARTILTSSAIAAAVIGFAARQVLANFVAGILLAITQPIRVGEWVCYEDDYGVVEDVTLTFTFLRTGSDRRVVIPNEKIVSNVVRNDTLISPEVGWDISVWIPPDADEARAQAALAAEAGRDVAIVEQVPWGTRLSVGGDPLLPGDKFKAETELRARCLRRLRSEGMLAWAGSQGPNANPSHD